MDKTQFLDAELLSFINKYFPLLDWEGIDTSCSAKLLLDDNGCIIDDLMFTIANAFAATITEGQEFTITINTSTNKLILYYID